MMLLTHSEGKCPAGSHPTEAARETKFIEKYALQAQECVNSNFILKELYGVDLSLGKDPGDGTKVKKQETWKKRSFLVANYVKYAFVYMCINICPRCGAVASKFIGYVYFPELLFAW